MRIFCRKLCLDEHSTIQISYMLLCERIDLEKNRGVFDTGYIVAVVTKSTTGNRWLSIFHQQYIQKADLEWSVKVTGL